MQSDESLHFSNRLFFNHCILMDSSTVIMLNESIYHFKCFRSILSLLFYFLSKILLANKVDPDQTPHMASDLSLQCLPMALLQISLVRMG